MSDAPIDGITNSVAPSETVAPGNVPGEQQGSTPAPVDPTANGQDGKGDEPDKQSRRDSRAFATQRREIRELTRQLGYMQAQLEGVRPQGGQPAEGDQPPARQTPSEVAASQRNNAAARLVMDRLEDAGDAIEGFDKVMSTITANAFPMTTVMRDFLGASDKPAEMAVWLSENPNEAHRISLQSDVVAHRSMERAEAKLTAKPVPRASTAPPPVPTVGGRSTPNFDGEKASMNEYAADWNRRNAK